jgi:hypothetical protein
VSDSNDRYDVRADWTTVAPLGDTLGVKTSPGFDDRWAKSFEVVLDEHERRTSRSEWGGIDFDHVSDGEDPHFVIYVRKILPGATAFELRRTLDELVRTANQVAQTGPHVYELARELREQGATSKQSAPPPPVQPLAEKLWAGGAS